MFRVYIFSLSLWEVVKIFQRESIFCSKINSGVTENLPPPPPRKFGIPSRNMEFCTPILNSLGNPALPIPNSLVNHAPPLQLLLSFLACIMNENYEDTMIEYNYQYAGYNRIRLTSTVTACSLMDGNFCSPTHFKCMVPFPTVVAFHHIVVGFRHQTWAE